MLQVLVNRVFMSEVRDEDPDKDMSDEDLEEDLIHRVLLLVDTVVKCLVFLVTVVGRSKD